MFNALYEEALNDEDLFQPSKEKYKWIEVSYALPMDERTTKTTGGELDGEESLRSWLTEDRTQSISIESQPNIASEPRIKEQEATDSAHTPGTRNPGVESIHDVASSNGIKAADLNNLGGAIPDPNPQGGHRGGKLTLLWLPDPPHGGKITIPCSRQSYITLATEWKLPEVILVALTQVDAAIPLSDPHGVGISTSDTIGASAFWGSYTKYTLLHNCSENATKVVAVGPGDFGDIIIEQVSRMSKLANIPTLAPLLVLEQSVEALFGGAWSDIGRLNPIAEAVGLNPWTSRTAVEQDADLIELTTELTKIAQELGDHRRKCELTMQTVKQTEDVHEQFRHWAMTNAEASYKDVQRRELAEVWVRLERLKQRLVAALLAIEEGEKAREANTQTIFTQIASRDNQLNFRAAEASIKLAEFTRRDSVDMRVIAAVTLVFLPGTFVATLFSTSFFNFSPARTPGTALVSHWIWLYWTVATGLTIMVMVSWIVTSRYMRDAHKVEMPSQHTPLRTRGTWRSGQTHDDREKTRLYQLFRRESTAFRAAEEGALQGAVQTGTEAKKSFVASILPVERLKLTRRPAKVTSDGAGVA